MRSAPDIDEVGCPEPAAVLQRMESMRSCWPSWRANSRSVAATLSVTAMSVPRTERGTAAGLALCALRLSTPSRHLGERGDLADAALDLCNPPRAAHRAPH